MCDGVPQCQDHSDEQHCIKQTEGCDHLCDDKTRCLPASFICDGERDCLDGTDEAKCGTLYADSLTILDCLSSWSTQSCHVCICLLQRTKRKKRLSPLLWILPLVHLFPSGVVWAPNPATTIQTVSTTTISVMEKLTAEMALMRKTVHQHVKMVTNCFCLNA